MSSPPEKKQKTGEEATETPKEAPKETPKETKPAAKAEPPKELETDATPVKGPALSEPIAFQAADMTLNVLPSSSGLLMSLNEHGLQHLTSGARANVGISTGRYFFEVKPVECFGQHPMLMMGFSTAGSSLLVGTTEDGVAFDSDGQLFYNKRPTAGQKNYRGAVFGVLLNLDVATTNACTMSLFRNGKRVTQPQPLPKALVGKVLYPHVCFRGSSVFGNFGPDPMAQLPFKCHMLQQAAKNHCTVAKADAGKCEVVYPVSLPDEGSFDWLDMFKEKNPNFTELSDRMILDWAEKSGMVKSGQRRCNDRPDIQGMDVKQLRRGLATVAPLQPRNYVVMEVNGNLLEDERKGLLKTFADAAFKKVATVLIGDPTTDFKSKTQAMTLKRKQQASDRKFRSKKAEEKKQKALEKQRKAAEKKRKTALKEAKKKARANKKAQIAAKKAKGEEVEELPESSEEEPEDADEDAEDPLAEMIEEEPPKVELDAEDKANPFFTHGVKDLAAGTFSSSFGKFSIPKKDEGFDDVRYVWSKGEKCQDYLGKWILDKKLNLRVEDIAPGAWSTKVQRQFAAAVNQWRKKVQQYKEQVAAKAKAKSDKAKAAEKAAKDAEKAAEKAEKDGDKAEKDAEKAEETKEEAEPEVEEEPVDFGAIDVYGARDILDVGSGIPLFKDWGGVDWAMLTLRFDLYLLAHAFKKDVKDEERPGVHVNHIPFYYQRYLNKTLSFKDYGVESLTELVKLASDTVYLNDQSVLQCWLPDEMETFAVFAKLVEDGRRHRSLRVLLGEESAHLKLSAKLVSSSGKPAQQNQQKQHNQQRQPNQQYQQNQQRQQNQQNQQRPAQAKIWGARPPLKTGGALGVKTAFASKGKGVAISAWGKGALGKGAPLGKGLRPTAAPAAIGKGAAFGKGSQSAAGAGLRPASAAAGVGAAKGAAVKGTVLGKGLRPMGAGATAGKGAAAASSASAGKGAAAASATAGKGAAAAATKFAITRPTITKPGAKAATPGTTAPAFGANKGAAAGAAKGAMGKGAAKGWGSGGQAWGCGGMAGAKGGKW